VNETLRRLLEEGIERAAFPAAQACVFRDGAPLGCASAGRTARAGAPVTGSTRFDVASLTKVMATTTAAYVLVSGGALRLDDPVSRFFPAFAEGARARITVRHLLAHTSGLPAWRPLFAGLLRHPELRALYPGAAASQPVLLPAATVEAKRRALWQRARTYVVEAAATTPLETEPGRVCVYSDPGFILLGEIVAACAGMPLDRFCAAWVFSPLGLESTGFRPLPAPAADPAAFAATGRTRPRAPARGQEGLYEIPPQRERDQVGEVDDDNCWAMGGVSGHAGLFSTAEDVARWGEAIRAEREGARRLGDPEVLATFLALDPHPEGPPRALGFDVPSGPASSAGRLLGRAGPQGARGHLAFTGCSVWIDFDRRLTVALLTNRVYPNRANEAGIRAFRPAFHDAVIDALAGD